MMKIMEMKTVQSSKWDTIKHFNRSTPSRGEERDLACHDFRGKNALIVAIYGLNFSFKLQI